MTFSVASRSVGTEERPAVGSPPPRVILRYSNASAQASLRGDVPAYSTFTEWECWSLPPSSRRWATLTATPTKDKFAMADGTAPIEASSGRVVRHRLNPGGNRQLNRAIHTAASDPDRPSQTAKDAATTRNSKPEGKPTEKPYASSKDESQTASGPTSNHQNQPDPGFHRRKGLLVVDSGVRFSVGGSRFLAVPFEVGPVLPVSGITHRLHVDGPYADETVLRALLH